MGDTENKDLDYEVTLKGLHAGLVLFGDRYRLERLLGRGGMGVVWLARDEELGSEVALKFLPDFVAADKVALADLKEETRRSLELTHPHIVRIHTFCTGEEMAAIAMEYVDGETLSEKRVDLPGKVYETTDEDFLKWVGELCEALGYAHAKRQIVHRDLKPSNLMVNGEGELKVTDFGIARSLNESRTRLSRTGGILGGIGGTLPYMSPQQAVGEPPSISDDIYSLGATLYELLTGKPPFYAGEVYEQVKTRVPPSVGERREELEVESKEEIPAEWETAIADCLSKDPEGRPESVAELAKRLGLGGKVPEAKAGELRKKRRAKAKRKGRGSRVLLGLAAAMAVSAGGWWFGYEQPRRSEVARQLDQAEAAVRSLDYIEAKQAFKNALEILPKNARAIAGMESLAIVKGSVEVRTIPAGAEVTVGESEPEESPLVVSDLPLGMTTIRADLPGYQPIVKEVSLRNDQLVREQITLSRSTGTLAVESVPAELEVKLECIESEAGESADLEYQKTGATPMRITSLPTGTYRVTMKRDGWPDYQEEVVVTASSVTVAKHEFSEGGFRITSEPAGLQAELRNAAGVLIGNEATPFTISELPTGTEFQLTVKRDGWPDNVRSLVVTSDPAEEIAIGFGSGKLSIDSNLNGLSILLCTEDSGISGLEMELDALQWKLGAPILSNENQVQLERELQSLRTRISEAEMNALAKPIRFFAPGIAEGIPNGRWEMLVRRPGSPSAIRQVSIEPDKTTQIELDYKSIKANAEKDRCRLAHNGVQLDRESLFTPMEFSALPGTYEMIAKFPNLPESIQEILIGDDSDQDLLIKYPGCKITVNTEPAGATTKYRGYSVGLTPVTLFVPDDKEFIAVVQLPGYADAEVRATVVAGENNEVLHQFSKEPEANIPPAVIEKIKQPGGFDIYTMKDGSEPDRQINLKLAEDKQTVFIEFRIDRSYTAPNGIKFTETGNGKGSCSIGEFAKAWIRKDEMNGVELSVPLKGNMKIVRDAGPGKYIISVGSRYHTKETTSLFFRWDAYGLIRKSARIESEDEGFGSILD